MKNVLRGEVTFARYVQISCYQTLTRKALAVKSRNSTNIKTRLMRNYCKTSLFLRHASTLQSCQVVNTYMYTAKEHQKLVHTKQFIQFTVRILVQKSYWYDSVQVNYNMYFEVTCFEFKSEFVLFFMSLPYPLESRFVSWRVKRLEKTPGWGT